MFELGPLITIVLAIIGTYIWFRESRRIEYQPKVSILWFTILLHTIWGILLFTSDAPLRITAIHTVVRMGLVSAQEAGTLYLSVALLAVMSLFVPGKIAALYLAPQNILLALSAFGATRAMFLGQFADGIIRDPAFIVTDQMPAILLFGLHTVVMWNLVIRSKERI